MCSKNEHGFWIFIVHQNTCNFFFLLLHLNEATVYQFHSLHLLCAVGGLAKSMHYQISYPNIDTTSEQYGKTKQSHILSHNCLLLGILYTSTQSRRNTATAIVQVNHLQEREVQNNTIEKLLESRLYRLSTTAPV